MYVAKEAIQGMVRTRYMSLISILTITVTLIMFSVVSFITVGANSIVDKIQRSEEVNVYLNDDISDSDMLALDETIRLMREVDSTRIISKEDAVKEFENMFGDDLLTALDENPLPRSIVVTMSKVYRNPMLDSSRGSPFLWPVFRRPQGRLGASVSRSRPIMKSRNLSPRRSSLQSTYPKYPEPLP